METRLIPYSPAPLPSARAVLVLAPHPDDEVFGCGGAIVMHRQAGVAVHVVLLTAGDAGGDAATRLEESAAAARLLGCAAPECWSIPDRQVAYGEALVGRLLEAIKRCSADLLYAPSLWENHPDHRAVALAAIEAVRRHGQVALMCYEIGAPLRPNLLLDITAQQAVKRAAMNCYPSQLERQAYDQQIQALNRYRSYTLSAEVEYAEAYEYYTAADLAGGALQLLKSEYLRQLDGGLLRLPADTPRVSVLVRSMDRDTLQQAFDSLAAQTWPNVEVVVVNAKGGRHTELPDRCGGFPLRLINQDGPRLARADAANLGLDQASGDFLLFLDDDDWLSPEHLSRLVEALLAAPDTLVAYTGVSCVSAEGTPLGISFDHEFDPAVLMASNFLPIHGVMFRRALVQQKQVRFDPAIDHYEDWDFWLQACVHGDFLHVPGVSAYYRLHASSGVHDNEPFSGEAYTQIYRKWRSRWPAETYGRLMKNIWQRHVETGLQSQGNKGQQQEQERLRTEIAHREQGIQALLTEKEQLIAHLDEHRALIRQQDAHIHDLQAEISRQQHNHDQLLAHLDEHRALIRQQDAHLAQQQTEIGARQQAHDQLLAHLDEHRALIQTQNTTIARLYASLSWRLTAPLRGIKRRIFPGSSGGAAGDQH